MELKWKRGFQMGKHEKKKDAHQLPCFGENFCDGDYIAIAYNGK